MKAQTTEVQAQAPQELVNVQAALPGTTSPDLLIPKGYVISETSTALVTVNQLGQPQVELFAHAPVYITERMVNNHDHLQYLNLGWYQDGRHHTLVVDRGVAMNQSKLQTLASNGFPVTSFNAGVLCKYLSDFEAVNRGTLLERDGPRTPLFFSLRDYEHVESLESIVTKGLTEKYGFLNFTYSAFLRLLEEGRLLLIFDAFDELATLSERWATVTSLRRLNEAVRGRSKVILTCRTHYFTT